MNDPQWKQLDWVPEITAYAIMEWADVYMGLRGTRKPYKFVGISAERFVAHRWMMGKVSALRTDHTR